MGGGSAVSAVQPFAFETEHPALLRVRLTCQSHLVQQRKEKQESIAAVASSALLKNRREVELREMKKKKRGKSCKAAKFLLRLLTGNSQGIF